jgi:hypothetical protein
MHWKEATFGTAVLIKAGCINVSGHIVRCGIFKRKALVNVLGWYDWYKLSELEVLHRFNDE